MSLQGPGHTILNEKLNFWNQYLMQMNEYDCSGLHSTFLYGNKIYMIQLKENSIY